MEGETNVDWSKIKTIFIFAFFVLDGFLLFWLLDKEKDDKYQYINEASFEDMLKAEEIKVNIDTDISKEMFYLQADPKLFTEEDVLQLKAQQVKVSEDGYVIKSILDEPIFVGEDVNKETMDPIVNKIVLNGDHYIFGKYNEIDNTVVYYQTHDNYTVFNNQSGRILFTLNENQELEDYVQTMLDMEPYESYGEQRITDVMGALETLHTNRKLLSGTSVEGVEIGYYTYVQISSQILAPAWHFKVNGQEEEDLYVDTKGHIIEMNDSKIIDESNITTE